MKKIPVDPKARALIFDCDGTLADTMPIHWAAWHQAFAVFGKTCPQEFLDSLAGVPATTIVERYNQEFQTNIPAQRFIKKKHAIAQASLNLAQPIEPVVQIVHDHYGKKPLAVVSGGAKKSVLSTLGAIGLTGKFDVIITADDPVPPKPSPLIFLEAAARLGVDSKDCLVFEDGDPGIRGAREAGMMVVDVREYL